MKTTLLLTLFSLSLIFFSGCSTKRVFEPKDVEQSWEQFGDLAQPIVDVTVDLAMLENGLVITKNKDLDISVESGYRLIGNSDGWIISASIDGKVKLEKIDTIDGATVLEAFDLKKTIACASVDGDTLAVLFADNEMALYSVQTKALLLKEQGGNALVIDTRIVSPYFLNSVVIFATLDGKVVIINRKTNKKLRAGIISSADNFNNVIYLNIIDKKIIAATAYQILAMSKEEVREKYEIRSVNNSDKSIFLTTKQGELISLTPDLQLNAKLKFPFAHFLGMIIRDETIYLLEKEGYLIVAPLDLSSYEIYEVDVDDGYVFVGDDKFYINDEFISVE